MTREKEITMATIKRKEGYTIKQNNMLRTITEKRKQQVKSILDVCTHVEVLNNGVHVTGYISYEQMKQVVEYLETKIRQGFWYKCIKDVMDNTGEICIFKAGNYYLCPKDGVLVSEDNRTMQWQAWHHPENCFVEDYCWNEKQREIMDKYLEEQIKKDYSPIDSRFDYEHANIQQKDFARKAMTANRQLYNRAILAILSNYIEKYPDIRFGQMLCNLDVNPHFDQESRETYWNLCKTINKQNHE